MRYPRPIPFREALDHGRLKTLLPTDLSSAELAQIPADILARGRFSARVRLASHLDVIDQGATELAAGTIDVATARLRVKQFLARIGYQPDPEKRGGLEDFSSDQRIDLQLTMNAQEMQAAGYDAQGQDADLLWAFPAREFVRVEAREEPRENWPQRWNLARSQTTAEGATDADSGVMAAVVNHPLWAALSVFGRPTEPYDYGSGMGQEDVMRRRAVALDIIRPDTVVPPRRTPLNAGLQASPGVRSATLRTLLEQTGLGRFDGDVFTFIGGGS